MAKSSASNVRSLAAANRKPNPAGGTNRDIKSIEFKKADGGLVSTTRSSVPDAAGFDTTTDTIHPSMSHASAHLEKHFGDSFNNGGKGK